MVRADVGDSRCDVQLHAHGLSHAKLHTGLSFGDKEKTCQDFLILTSCRLVCRQRLGGPSWFAGLRTNTGELHRASLREEDSGLYTNLAG